MPIRRYTIHPAGGGSPCGELRFTPDADGATSGSTDFVVAGPSGEAWMTLVREQVQNRELVVILPGRGIGQGPHDRDVEQLEAVLRTIAKSLPLRVEGLPPEPPSPPVDAALLDRLRRSLAGALSRHALPEGVVGPLRALLESPDPSRLLAGLFDAGESGPEPLRRLIDELQDEFRAADASPALSAFARAWLKFRVEKPKRVH